jgi:hypothetical protein
MLEAALKLLRKNKAVGTADLKAALAGLDLAAAEAEVERLETARRQALLGGDDAALVAVEARIVAGNRDVERIGLMIDELQRRIAKAEGDALETALTDELARVAAEAEEVELLLKDRYPQLAAELVQLLTRLQSAEAAVATINSRLVAAGRSGARLAPVEARVIPVVSGMLVEPQSLLSRTRLRSFSRTRFAPGWNDAAAQFFGD